jgi:hypothetical protein
MNFTIVTTSWKDETCRVRLPFYCHIAEKRNLSRKEQKTSSVRVDFLAQLRNEATEAALDKFPGTTHIVNLESYYLRQIGSIKKLVRKYRAIQKLCILGGTIWWRDYTLSPSMARFYDTWCFPELANMTYTVIPPRGLRRVSSVGSCLIFPREVWETHKFVNPQPFPEAGIYYNWLCLRSGLPVFADLGIRFFRDATNSDVPKPPYWKRRIRNTVATWLQ